MMATKDELMPLKKKFMLQNVSGKNQYSNLDLNQTHKCLDQSFLHSKSKSFINNKSFDLKIGESKNEKGSLNLWNKPSSNKAFKSFLAFDEAETDDAKKRWKNEPSLKTKPSSSTLSLHIAAYENFIEGGDTVTWGKKDSLKKKEKSSGSIEGKKQLLINSTLDPIEFPRQQRDDETKPEVMQFTASQQLLNPNQSNPSEDNQQGTQNVADVQPALVHSNQHPEQNSDTGNFYDIHLVQKYKLQKFL